MTEMELRQKLVSTAKAYLGCTEADGTHRKIIDIYNAHKPLAVGYKVSYTDAWCSTFVSAMSILCGMTDILPTECGCGRHIDLFKKLGAWVESDTYVPKIGDVVFYNWNDSGVGECTSGASHVGIVTSCDGKNITVIEGNIGNAVGYRTIAVDGRYIRGFGVPKYDKLARKEDDEMRYNTVADLKADKEYGAAYLPTVEKLIKKGYLKGKGGEGDELVIDLTEDSVRLLVILDRAGNFK
ncbi:MAG: CHAP domain-containing protein [Christensenellaceae bacterium]|nr:CHAP domain-containing protein [Christensenellaceae bacterium]